MTRRNEELPLMEAFQQIGLSMTDHNNGSILSKLLWWVKWQYWFVYSFNSSFTTTAYIEACRKSHYSGLCMAYVGSRAKSALRFSSLVSFVSGITVLSSVTLLINWLKSMSALILNTLIHVCHNHHYNWIILSCYLLMYNSLNNS